MGRKSRHLDFQSLLLPLQGKRVIVTGSAGSLGCELMPLLDGVAAAVKGVDKASRTGDVLAGFNGVCDQFRPDVIFHLAAAKHAPVGEVEPYETAYTNIEGTQNVLEAAYRHGAVVVTASTCKAVNPETAYGASKLIAERMTLNYELGRVARFHNVVETQGNVFEIWENTPQNEPIRFTNCQRFFLTKNEAVSLLLYAASAPRGLYSFYSGPAQWMGRVAARLYGTARLEQMAPRRGDRITEPFAHREEWHTELEGGLIVKLEGPHAGA